MKNFTAKLLVFGFLTWLIPFVSSLFFYSADGQLIIDKFLFKSIMIVIAGAFSSFLLVRFFRTIEGEFLRTGLVIGSSWFAINIVLDVIILIALLNTGVQEYIYEIGLRYLIIPTMSIAIGAAVQQAKPPAALSS